MFGALSGCSDDAPAKPADAAVDLQQDAGVQPDQRAADEGAADQASGPSWDVTVTLSFDGTTKEVNLGALDTTEFLGGPAIRLTRVVEVAALEQPWAYTYNFIASDDFSVARDKFEGDYAQVPYYGELELGYLHWVEGELRVGWEESAGFPKALNVKAMAGGTIELQPIAANQILVHAGDVRALVDLSALPTQDVVNYKHPEDGALPMVPLSEIFKAAAVATPAGLKYKIWGDDGFANADDNLMPHESAVHGYVNPDGKRVIMEEAWDTDQCCWSIKGVVVIKGVE